MQPATVFLCVCRCTCELAQTGRAVTHTHPDLGKLWEETGLSRRRENETFSLETRQLKKWCTQETFSFWGKKNDEDPYFP